MKDDNERLKKENKELEGSKAKMELATRGIIAENKEMAKETAEMKKDKEKMQTENAAMKAEMEKLRTENERMEKVINKTKKGRELLKEERKKLKAEKEKPATKKELKKMTAQEMQEKKAEIEKKRRQLEEERKELKRKEDIMIKFAKENPEGYKETWVNMRDQNTKLFEISQALRGENEKIAGALKKGVKDSAFGLRIDVLKVRPNEDKNNILFVLDQEGRLSKENEAVVKAMLEELHEKNKTRMNEIDKIGDKEKKFPSMGGAFRIATDKSLSEEVGKDEEEQYGGVREANAAREKVQAVSEEEFEKLDETIGDLANATEAEWQKIFPDEKLFSDEAENVKKDAK